MKKLLTLLLPFALIACDTGSADGYKFEEKEFESLTPNIEFVPVENKAELVQRFKAANGHIPEDRELQAFSILYPDTNTCIVFIIDPVRSYEPEWIGHEVVHCIYGRFHPSQ